jgi:hypothetical protein
MMRNIIIHYHIFKNAGTSIDHLLARSFGERWGAIEGPSAWSIVTSDQVRRFLLQRADLVAISSHQARRPLPINPGWNIFPMVILRHPIDRVASAYRFERAQGVVPPDRRDSLADYIQWRLSESRGPGIINFQTVALSSAQLEVKDPREARATRHHLESAKNFLASLPVFGLVEELEESIGRFGRWLQPVFPTFELVSTRQNVSQRSGTRLSDRVQEIRSEIGETLYGTVVDSNKFDLDLYDFARRLFEVDRTH